MAWLRVDDTALTHPRVMRLRSMEDDVVTAEGVVGFVMLAATWSGQHLTDCFIPESVGMLASPRHWQRLADAALKVGMLKRIPKQVARRDYDGQPGWLVNIDDGLFHLMSKEEVERNREHRRASRQNDAKAAVLERDGDMCRYCALTVNPKDTKGDRGRQLDHPDPAVPDELVVACRRCNRIKDGRTPEEANMPLLPPPAAPVHLHPSTRAWLDKHGTKRPDSQSDTATRPTPRPGHQPDTAAPPAPPARPDSQSDPAPARPGPSPDPAPSRPGSQPDHATDRPTDHRPTTTDHRPPREVAGQVVPGRDGTGRVGPVPAAVAAVAAAGHPSSRDGPPRPARRRGRRGKQARAP